MILEDKELSSCCGLLLILATLKWSRHYRRPTPTTTPTADIINTIALKMDTTTVAGYLSVDNIQLCIGYGQCHRHRARARYYK